MAGQQKTPPETLSFDEAVSSTDAASPQSATQVAAPGFLENLGHAFGVGQKEAEARHQDIAAHPVRAGLEALGGPIVPMLKGIYGGAKRTMGELWEAYDAAKEGNGAGVGVHAVQAIPLVGSAMKTMTDELPATPGRDYGLQDITGGNVGTAIGTAAQIAPLLLGGAESAGGRQPRLTSPALAKITDPVRAYRSPLIPPDEAVARAATDVLKPNPMDYRSTVSTLKDNLPYIKAQTGGKFKSPIEFAKAAGNAGKEHSDFFRDQLVEPNRSYGQVGPSYDQLQTINDKLRPIYKARSMGEQMTKESQDNMVALEAQRDGLNDYLYRELSARSGLPEDQIRAINQRGGSLQHVGDAADSAQAMRRAGFSGYSPGGLPIPMGGFERAMRLVKALRGGPEAAAGRQLTRIGKLVDGEPEALPDVETIGAYRKLSDVDELSHVRQQIEKADQNRMNSRLRVATREPSPLVVREYQRLRDGVK